MSLTALGHLGGAWCLGTLKLFRLPFIFFHFQRLAPY